MGRGFQGWECLYQAEGGRMNEDLYLGAWLLRSLGKRVVLQARVGDYPRGRTGRLISIQAGVEPGASGPYATVNFDLGDWSAEENVPLAFLRPLSVKQ